MLTRTAAPHACHSVTKSYAGTLAAALEQEGVLDASKTITHYVPELRVRVARCHAAPSHKHADGAGVHGAYGDERASVWAYARPCGWRPR
nr:beta-lactamase family protein [Bradyrhizobium sp. 35]